MPNEFQLFPEFGELFGKEAELYALSLARRFGEVKVLGMLRPVPLLSLYVRANILEKITSRSVLTWKIWKKHLILIVGLLAIAWKRKTVKIL